MRDGITKAFISEVVLFKIIRNKNAKAELRKVCVNFSVREKALSSTEHKDSRSSPKQAKREWENYKCIFRVCLSVGFCWCWLDIVWCINRNEGDVINGIHLNISVIPRLDKLVFTKRSFHTQPVENFFRFEYVFHNISGD